MVAGGEVLVAVEEEREHGVHEAESVASGLGIVSRGDGDREVIRHVEMAHALGSIQPAGLGVRRRPVHVAREARASGGGPVDDDAIETWVGTGGFNSTSIFDFSDELCQGKGPLFKT